MNQFLLIMYGLSLALSISGAEIFGGLLLLSTFCPYLFKKSRPQWEKSPLDIPILAFVAWNLICVLLTHSIPFHEVLTKQSALLIFFLVAHGLEVSDLKNILFWFCIGCGVAAIWGILVISPKFGRAVGSRSHPLTYAETFIPVIFVLMGSLSEKILRGKEKILPHWKEILILFLILTGLVLSRSRGVWLGVFFGFIILMSSWPKKPAALLFVSLLLAGLAVGSLSPDLKKRAISIVSPSSGSASDYESSSTRIELWRQSLQVIKAHPLRGVGMGGAQLKTNAPFSAQERIWSESHNLFLQSGLDGGLVGLGFLLWVLITSVFCITRMSPPWRIVCLSIFTAFLIAGLTESWTHDKEIAFLFWGFLGAIELIRREGWKVNDK